MIYFKSCPKCQGDLTMSQDTYGSYIKCLQCGLMRDVDTKPVASDSANRIAVVLDGYLGEEPLAKAA